MWKQGTVLAVKNTYQYGGPQMIVSYIGIHTLTRYLPHMDQTFS